MQSPTIFEQRHSTRRFADRPVEREKLERLIALAKCAPSGMNSQPYRFVIVTKKELNHEIAVHCQTVIERKFSLQSYRDQFHTSEAVLYDAPAVVYLVSTTSTFATFDSGIATGYLVLAAHYLGLGSVPVGMVLMAEAEDHFVSKMLGLKPDEQLQLAIPVGYPHPEHVPPAQFAGRKTDNVLFI